MGGGIARQVPQAVWRAVSPDELAGDGWCDGVRALGSYWSRRENLDLQSQLVKYFKESGPLPVDRPCMRAIVHTYAAMLADIAQDWRPDAVVRVLASDETRPDPARPHSLLAAIVSKALAAQDLTRLFFRTETRKPMRMIGDFAGPEALNRRIRYVLQDLFISPEEVGRTVLLIDDIYNLGATARVYAAALKRLAAAERVYSVNLGAARFARGRDGWGHLSLDSDRFIAIARRHMAPGDPTDAFDDAWVVRAAGEYHHQPDCPRIEGRAHRSIRFFAANGQIPCPTCAASKTPGPVRRWFGSVFRF